MTYKNYICKQTEENIYEMYRISDNHYFGYFEFNISTLFFPNMSIFYIEDAMYAANKFLLLINLKRKTNSEIRSNTREIMSKTPTKYMVSRINKIEEN